MSDSERVDEPLSEDDAKFVGTVRTHFDPSEMTVERRVAFTHELDARIARRRRRRRLVPVVAGAVAVTVLAVRFWPGSTDSTPFETGEPTAVPLVVQADAEWEDELLFSAAATGSSSAESEDEDEASSEFEAGLPSDYAAIGSLFLDG